MNEADLKLKLVKQINELPGTYACRVEDRWRPGVLDLFIKPPRHPAMWAEAKIIKGNLFGPTKRQYEEGKKLLAAGVPTFLIGWKDGVMYVSDWMEKADIRTSYFRTDLNFAHTLIECLNERAKE